MPEVTITLSGETGESCGVAADLVSPTELCGSSSSFDSPGRQDSVTCDRPFILVLERIILLPIGSCSFFTGNGTRLEKERVVE